MRNQSTQYDTLEEYFQLHDDIPEIMVDVIENICKENNLSWNQLTHRIQFLPFLTKYLSKLYELSYVNEIVPFGGITEYPKSDIHQKIDQRYFPKSVYITDTQRKSLSERKIKEFNLSYPVYFKLETGERGQGVTYCPDYNSLLQAVGSCEEAFSIQENCAYTNEYCVQFYNIHGTYKIGSVARRDIPHITGDGISTVQSCIESQLGKLHTPRVIENIISTLQREYPVLLQAIPDQGATQRVVMKASIDNGTIYKKIYGNLQGLLLKGKQSHQNLGKLENWVNTVLGTVQDGLDYGRMDLTADSHELLLEGKADIIEINAGGAIPTHVYDDSLHLHQIMNELHAHFARVDALINERKDLASPHKRQSIRDSKSEFYKALNRSLKKKGVENTDLLKDITMIVKNINYTKALTKLLTKVQFSK